MAVEFNVKLLWDEWGLIYCRIESSSFYEILFPSLRVRRVASGTSASASANVNASVSVCACGGCNNLTTATCRTNFNSIQFNRTRSELMELYENREKER